MIDAMPRETKSHETSAVIDPSRCVRVGDTDEMAGAVWVCLVGPREEVDSDAAQKLAQRYWTGATARKYGPLPDGPNVKPPVNLDAPPAGGGVMTQDSYLQRAAMINSGRQSDVYVCFYLIRKFEG